MASVTAFEATDGRRRILGQARSLCLAFVWGDVSNYEKRGALTDADLADYPKKSVKP